MKDTFAKSTVLHLSNDTLVKKIYHKSRLIEEIPMGKLLIQELRLELAVAGWLNFSNQLLKSI